MSDEGAPPKVTLPGAKLFGRLGGGVPIALGLVGGLAFLAAAFFFSQTIGPDEFAIRQVMVGPGAGIQQQPLGPGRRVVIPGYERLHVFPRTMQMLDLNGSKASEAALTYYRSAPAILIQTSEGYQVQVDVTVLYRIVDPYMVLTKVGPGRMYEDQVVAGRSDKILRQTLGQLNAEEFYSDDTRTKKSEQARSLLAEDLAQWGIQVWAVLVRDYIYDERYQKAIEERKIQDQSVFKNQAEAIAAERDADRNRVVAEGAASIAVEAERGRAEVRKIAAEADSYARKRVSEGDLLVALAEAEGTRLENAALQQAGAAQIVGLEMAKALQGTEVIVISTTGPGGVNPLDLDQLIRGW